MSQQINLVNPAFQKRRELFNARTLLLALAALVLIMGSAYGYQHRQVSLLEQQLKVDSSKVERERARLVTVATQNAPRQKDPALEKRVDDMEQQLKGEDAVLEVLQSGNLGNMQGYSDYMRAFARQTVNGLWLTGFGIKGAGKEMSLSGRTLRPELVPAYIQRLEKEEATHGRVFAALEIQRPKADPSSPGAMAGNKPTPNYLEFKLYSAMTAEVPK